MNRLADDLIMLGAAGAFLWGLYQRLRGQSYDVSPSPAPQGTVTLGTPIISEPKPLPSLSSAPVPAARPDFMLASFSDGGAFVSRDVDVLARTLWGEARGEGARGMEAVASVIMNRVRSPRFPGTVEGVCKQPWQFSSWNANDPNLPALLAVTASDANFKRALSIAERAVNGRLVDPTRGALHYYANWIAEPAWARGATVTARIGQHIFLTGVA